MRFTNGRTCRLAAVSFAALLLAGCGLEDSRLGDADLPYQLTLGTTYANIVLPPTHADHWQFTAPANGTGDVTAAVDSTTSGLNIRISATAEGAGVWNFSPNHGATGLETRSSNGELAPGGGTFYLIIDVSGNGGANYSLTVSAW